MQFIAHRGFWKSRDELNTTTAFNRAFENGFGVETDVRDLDGSVVVCHDMPRQGALTLLEFLEGYTARQSIAYLALNIKSDGLQYEIKRLLNQFKIENYFLFDMSVPDCLLYIKNKLRVYCRRSQYEPISSLSDLSQGVWLDHFGEGFVSPDWIDQAITSGKPATIVSPELHGHSHHEAWMSWKSVLGRYDPIAIGGISLCTDLPDEAQNYFAGIR